MADEEHLAQMKLGVSAWNQWRGAHRDIKPDLCWANLSRTSLSRANLSGADISKANLSGADLSRANLSRTHFAEANLSGAILEGALLARTNLKKANLTDCRIFGISAWGIQLEETHQANLVITPSNEAIVSVDNLEVAQFIYLLLHNEKLREVIDTITSKAVLTLGRFTRERKAVLDAIR